MQTIPAIKSEAFKPVSQKYSHITQFQSPTEDFDLSKEAKRLFLKEEFAVFLPYKMLDFGLSPGSHLIDLSLYSIFASACFTNSTGKFSCNFWGSTLAGYLSERGNQAEWLVWVYYSLQRLRSGNHIRINTSKVRQSHFDLVDGSKCILEDKHLEITLLTRFDPRQRRVVFPKY